MTIAAELAQNPVWLKIKAMDWAPPKGLTCAQAAQRLGNDVLTVEQWVRSERCPLIREGGAVHIPADWVEWLRQVAVPD